jgi:mono/diheme cytochrome c family protein
MNIPKLLLLLVFFIAGLANATEVVRYSGEENFQRLCAACHGSGGQGDGPVAEVLSVPVPDLTRLAQRNGGELPRETLKQQIDGRDRISAHGTQQMPVWGYEFWIDEGAGAFSEQRVSETLDDLVAYLASIQRTCP